MKKMILAALAMAVTLPAATSSFAQYDDDIYYSSSAVRYEPVEETPVEEWSTNANNDWDIDSYNRRTSYVADNASTTETYAQSVSSAGSRHQSFTFGTEPETAGQHITVYDTIPVAVYDTIPVCVVENYYFSNRIRRFHNPYFSRFVWDPYWDVAYWDPFYWDYCYWDPWWYVTPSFGFHYGNWYWGWNYGYYSGWYGGWYSPYYNPYPHYYGPYYGGGHYWRSLPNRGSRINNMGGSYAHHRNARPNDRQYTHNSRYGNSSSSNGRMASTRSRGEGTRVGNLSNSTRRSNLSLTNPQIQRISDARANGRNVTTGGTTVRGNRGSSTSTRTQSAAATSDRMPRYSTFGGRTGNNSNARRQENGVRQNTQGRTYRSTERSSSSSSSFNRNSRSNYSSGSNYSNSRSYNSGSSSSSSSSSQTRSYSTPSRSYSGSSSSSSSGSFGGRSSGGGGGRSSGGGGSFGGRR